MELKSVWFYILLLLPAAVIISIIFLFPFILLVVKSFWTYQSSFMAEPVFTLANYVRIFEDPYYLRVYGRTVKLSLISTGFTLILSYPLARLITRLPTGLKGFVISLVTLPLIGGAMIQSMSWLVMMMRHGPLNSILIGLGLVDDPVKFLGSQLGVLIGLVQSFIPLLVLPLVASMGTIDESLEEAARSLGANQLQTFLKVVFPLSLPGMIAGTILVLMANLTMFVTPSVLGQNRVQVFGTMAYQQALYVGNWPFASAFAVFFLLIMGLLALVSYWLSRKLQSRVV